MTCKPTRNLKMFRWFYSERSDMVYLAQLGYMDSSAEPQCGRKKVYHPPIHPSTHPTKSTRFSPVFPPKLWIFFSNSLWAGGTFRKFSFKNTKLRGLFRKKFRKNYEFSQELFPSHLNARRTATLGPAVTSEYRTNIIDVKEGFALQQQFY